MTKKNRNKHTPAFKAKVALAAIKGGEELRGSMPLWVLGTPLDLPS